MAAVWLVASFVLWIGFGYGSWRGIESARLNLSEKWRKTVRAIAAFLILFASAALLLSHGAVLMQSGVSLDQLDWWSRAKTTIVGCAFVAGQVVAAALMLSLVERPVTKPPSPASISQNQKGKDS